MKKQKKQRMHFTHPYLINPTNPIAVNLIGAGGTGSHIMGTLAKIDYALRCLGHAGLQVSLWDDDTVTEANLGRQLFAETEVGLLKSVALINRINRFCGTNWKAIPERFSHKVAEPDKLSANIYISCVDTSQSRFEIGSIINAIQGQYRHHRDNPLYWMDYGNSHKTGQAILSTVGEIDQPRSQKFVAVPYLPSVIECYREDISNVKDTDEASCSLAEAITKQDLFINPSIAQMGSALLWKLFREGMISSKGFFMNLDTFKVQPILV